MSDEQNIGPELQELVREMLRMLISYEVELTAYYLVLQGAQEKFIAQGIPWDMMSNVRTILKTPAAQVEAEAMYAPFYALLQRLTPQNLEVALATLRRRIADYEANLPPNVP